MILSNPCCFTRDIQVSIRFESKADVTRARMPPKNVALTGHPLEAVGRNEFDGFVMQASIMRPSWNIMEPGKASQ